MKLNIYLKSICTNTSFLDILQEYFEGLAGIIWPFRQQIRHLLELKGKLISGDQQSSIETLNNLLSQVTKLLNTLVRRSFVVEKQPPQVMKTNTRFALRDEKLARWFIA